MALVTVTGNVLDITGAPDPDTLHFFTDEIRDGVLSTKHQRVAPNASTGAFSVQLQAGPAVVLVRGKRYPFTAAAGELLPQLLVGLAVPPDTAAQKLQAAVDDWASRVADGRYASLQGGKLNPAQLPDLALIDYLGDVASQSAMLALTGQKGDWCTRTDTNTDWIITGTNPSQIGSWRARPLPASALTKTEAAATYAPIDKTVLGWAAAGSYNLITATRNSGGGLTGGTLLWPDGATGVITTTLSTDSASLNAINAYAVTHVLGGVTTTYTQPTMTRDSTTGAVTAQPALVVS